MDEECSRSPRMATMKAKPKQVGMYPNAHPTAPGGMSQQALADELVTKHGLTEHDINLYWKSGKSWSRGSWPEMIDRVIAERQAREAEAKREAEDELDEFISAITGLDVNEMFADESDPIDEADDLLADM